MRTLPRSLSLVMRIWVSCCRLLLLWTLALNLCWKPQLMMLEECGKSLMSTTFLNVKLDRMVASVTQWICLILSYLKARRTVAFGLVPHSVPILGCSFINPWSNGRSCLICSPKKRGFQVVFCANHQDGSLSILPQVCMPMT